MKELYDGLEVNAFCTNYLRRVYDYYGRTGIETEVPFYKNIHDRGLWYYYSDNRRVTRKNLVSRGYIGKRVNEK